MPLRAIYKPESPLKRWRRRAITCVTVLAINAVALVGLCFCQQHRSSPSLWYFLLQSGCPHGSTGLSAGIIALALDVLALEYFVLPPTRSLRISDPDDVIRLVVFAVLSSVLVYVMAKLRQTQEALKLAHERFQLAHEIARVWAWEVELATSKVTWASTPDAPVQTAEDTIHTWLATHSSRRPRPGDCRDEARSGNEETL